MASIRLMNRPDDFERLGVNPKGIEPWEDGRRNLDERPNNWEWWYSDFIFSDGSTAVAQFFTKQGRKIGNAGDSPAVNLRIKLADGRELSDNLVFKASEGSFSTEGCDVHIADNRFTGDLHTYHVKAMSKKGFGVDVTLTSTAAPYRPGTAYVEMGEPDTFYTWLCAVPSGTVEGTFYYDDQPHEVTGTGYHDHQWGNTNFLMEWNHWVWARQRFDDCTMLVFDLVAAQKHNFERLPIAFIQDADGNLLFESVGNMDCEVLHTYHDDVASDKDYPDDIRYTFRDGAQTASYHLKAKKILETGGIKTVPLAMRLLVKKMGISHSYTRYLADGELQLTGGTHELERSSELIYEFMFPGDTIEGHM